jgi:hypothetical protein
MSMTVKQTINDQCVSVRPVYRGGVQAAYWADIVNERALLRHFQAPGDVFRFVKRTR